MAQTRIKSAALDVPASDKEAQDLLRRIGDLDAQLDQVSAEGAEAIRKAKSKTDAKAAPLKEAISEAVIALQVYVERERSRLLPRRGKSVAWPTGTVGFRTAPLSVSVTKKEEGAIVDELKSRELAVCLRVSEALDKEQLKKNRSEVEDIKGLTFRRREEFYAKPLNASVEHVKAVAKPPPRRSSRR